VRSVTPDYEGCRKARAFAVAIRRDIHIAILRFCRQELGAVFYVSASRTQLFQEQIFGDVLRNHRNE
jgi:hypothetical protein